MSDSKLNKKVHDAVRTGSRGAARKIRSTWHNMRIWQKVGLILCVVFWIASVILGAVCGRITGNLVDQHAAERWSDDENYAQVSCFMANGSGGSEDTVKAMYTGLMLDLQSDAIALSETQIDNGASLLEECYCGMGSVELTVNYDDPVTVEAIGVGGNFFNFHPLDLIDGYYFADDDLMQDRILIDDQTAWRLFGSPNVVGMCVRVAGVPHYVAGVFRQPRERFYADSGMGSYLIFMSYDSLCKYTEASSTGDDGSSEEGAQDMDGMDAFAPLQKTVSAGEAEESVQAAQETILSAEHQNEPAAEKAVVSQNPSEPSVPRTAAYMPDDAEKLPGQKEASLSEDLDVAEPDDSSGEYEDTSDAGEEASEESSTNEKEEEPLNDDPVGENFGSDGSGSGKAGTGKDGEESEEEAVEINRSRISCYEVVMPNPVASYALRKVRSRLEQIPFPMNMVTVVDNTSRFDILRLCTLVAQPGVRSMQTAPIRYPYWENVALAWEDVLIPYALLWMFLRYSPIVFLLCLLIWYATHKSWTLGGIVRDIQDKMYDRESARIYGKRSGDSLSVNHSAAIAAGDDGADERTEDDDSMSGEDIEDGTFTPLPEDAADAADEVDESAPQDSGEDEDTDFMQDESESDEKSAASARNPDHDSAPSQEENKSDDESDHLPE